MPGIAAVGRPAFAECFPLLQDAYAVAAAVHSGGLGNGHTSLEHPVAVAQLLHDAGYPEHVVAAALLHDTVEDGGPAVVHLRARFGSRVARLVDQLTEDPNIASFARRKETLRGTAAADVHEAAAIFAADKLTSARALLRAGGDAPPEKLEHYESSLSVLHDCHPEVPFLTELSAALLELQPGGRQAPRP